MKNQERRDMKKIIVYLILSLSFFSFGKVLAEENTNSTISTTSEETYNLDLANNLKIKYKWYKLERVEGTFYKKGEELPGYLEDTQNITYSSFSGWANDNCNYLSNPSYAVEGRFYHEYKLPPNTKYLKINNYEDIKSIKVYSHLTPITYEYLKNTKEEILLDLKGEFSTDSMWIYVETNKPFEVSFFYKLDPGFYSAYKSLTTGGIYIPDKTWLEKNKTYRSEYTAEKVPDTELKVHFKSTHQCRYREIKTYRYKLKKQYYDDNYYEYLEGYIPDTTTYLAEYTGEIPEKTIEVIKEVTKDVPIPEYISEDDETISIEKECPEAKPEIKTQYIENDVIHEVYKIPKKIYLFFVIFLAIIIYEFLLIRKKSNKNIN